MSRDHTMALQPGQQEQNFMLKKKILKEVERTLTIGEMAMEELCIAEGDGGHASYPVTHLPIFLKK